MTTERTIPESRMAINPVHINDSFRSMPIKGLPETLSTAKVLAWFKSSKVDTTDTPMSNYYVYNLGRNMLADLTIAGIYMGEFDVEEKK